MSDPRAIMRSGAWYNCLSDDYENMRQAARRACHQHATMDPDTRGPMAPLLADLFAVCGEDCKIEAPFHCSYGVNIHFGDRVYLNAGCTILDGTFVTIGNGTMIGPGTQIITADHHRDPDKRRIGIERGLPVTIGADVWIGGGAIILPGVTLGDGVIVGAGAVVTKDVAPGLRVAGVPARSL